MASGDSIRWYGDPALTELLHSGNSFIPGQPSIGTSTFYVTQTVAGSESDYSQVDLSVNRLPYIMLGEDTTIYRDQHVMLGPYSTGNSYLWNDGSVNPYFEFSGNESGPGDHIISVMVTDTNTCSYADSLTVHVVFTTNTGKPTIENDVTIYPNPADNVLNIKIPEMHSGDIEVKLYNQEGGLLKDLKTSADDAGNVLRVNIAGLPHGIYYLKITARSKTYTGKLIIK
jgi:hypothetical protein